MLVQASDKVNEQAEEALRLARSRLNAGTVTQLEVLSAETALRDAALNAAQARRDYSVAEANFERAIGTTVGYIR